VLDVPWRGGAPGWHLRAAMPLGGRLRARALAGATVVVLSGELWRAVVVLVVLLVTP
jgi:hypothetical protein